MKNTEKALEVLLDTGMKVVNALEDDGKIDFGESIGIAMKGINLIGVFKTLPEIREELKTITPEKVANLVEIFKTKFDLPNDELEQKIEQGIEVLASLAVMVFTQPKAA
jgi:hypothetical protein